MAAQPDQGLSAAGDRGVPLEVVRRYEQALTLWVAWNDANERITAEMFEARNDPGRVEELLRQADELRAKALGASRALLQPSPFVFQPAPKRERGKTG
jgi:hypothetical protein